MSIIVRFPVLPGPRQKQLLARQAGLSEHAFERRLRQQTEKIEGSGTVSFTERERRFIADCSAGRITPRDIAGQDSRAATARRIIRDLNAEGRNLEEKTPPDRNA